MNVKKIQHPNFDPNGAGSTGGGIFGLPFGSDQSSLILVPVPWEATTSYARGTASGPRAILEASPQLDLFDPELLRLGLPRPWEYGIYLEPEEPWLVELNRRACELSAPLIERGGAGPNDPDLVQVNQWSKQVQDFTYQRTRQWRQQGKLVGLVGGEHSIPLGAIAALGEEFPDLGVLQIDAHADLRPAYEGFQQSHASIMHNVLEQVPISHLVQVGVRDLCELEYERATHDPRITTHYDPVLQERLLRGESWHELCKEIIGALPEHVYCSFDIDGLDPGLCPATGTPVPGGLSFAQANLLLKSLVQSGRKIVGFDLNEVAPDANGGQWNGNVGARVLYRLCGFTLRCWSPAD